MWAAPLGPVGGAGGLVGEEGNKGDERECLNEVFHFLATDG